jgi:cellulose synthase/poly-beta-1,6-N-acetylglucosamine synthase-like glycosyltransferase
MLIFFAGVLFYTIFLLILIAGYLIRLRLNKPYPPTDEFAVAVIVPCKGNDDPRFEANLISIIKQDYKGLFQFAFCLESETDPAMPILQSLARQFENVEVCVAGLATQSSQKVFNILQGMARFPRADIFLIADADIHPHSTWLREMVAPFQNPAIGATTGYYRRAPVKPYFQFGDYLAGLVNAVLTIFTADDRAQGLWGGSMALRKSVMDKYNLYQRLSTEIVDDLAVMQTLHQHRIKRQYVPSCTVKSYCDMSIPDSIEWLIRQLQYLQLYFKPLYLLFIAISCSYIWLILCSPAIFVYGLLDKNWPAVVGSLGFWFSMLAASWLMQLAIPVNPASVAPTDQPYRLAFWLPVTPAAALATGYALLKTMFRVKRNLLTMQWRGVKYRIDTKTRQVVEIIR